MGIKEFIFPEGAFVADIPRSPAGPGGRRSRGAGLKNISEQMICCVIHVMGPPGDGGPGSPAKEQSKNHWAGSLNNGALVSPSALHIMCCFSSRHIKILMWSFRR